MGLPFRVAFVASIAFAASLDAQQVIRLVHGTRVGGMLGQVARPAGDVDGDGVPDMLLTEPDSQTFGGSGSPRVYLVSGATGATLRTLNSSSALDATGMRDVNNDGRRDIAIISGSGAVQVFSGLNGQLLFNAGGAPLVVVSLVDVGDLNGDGRGDLAAMTNNGGTLSITLFSGNNGVILGSLPSTQFGSGKLVGIRDVNGDQRTDLLTSDGNNVIHVCTTNPLRIANSLSAPAGGTLGREFAAADVNGDGIDEVLAHGFFPNSQGGGEGIYAFSASTGAVVRTYVDPLVRLGGAIARIGDLDGDGADEFAAPQFEIQNDIAGRIVILSGRTGATFGVIPCDALTPASVIPSGFPFFGTLGDIDADGFGDLVCGFISGFDGNRGGYRVISGKLLADVVSKGGACGYGPFPVQLGCTRPILGSTAQVVCRDGPSACCRPWR